MGVDDQLIDEAILGTKDGKERGELGGRGGVGSDDEEEKASRLGDNDGGRVPHVDTPPGIITGQSGKPSPASPTEITTACLQTSSRTTTASSDGGNDNGAPGPNPDGDVRQLFFFFCAGFPPSWFVQGRATSRVSAQPRAFSFVHVSPFHPRTRSSRWWRDRVNTSLRAVLDVSPSVPEPSTPPHVLRPGANYVGNCN